MKRNLHSLSHSSDVSSSTPDRGRPLACFRRIDARPPCIQTHRVMNILIRRADRWPVRTSLRGHPWGRRGANQALFFTRVTGDYDAGHIFHYHPLGRCSVTRGRRSVARSLQFLALASGRFHHVEERSEAVHSNEEQ